MMSQVTLESGGQQEDSKDYKLGLRTVELRQEPDEWGLSFGFRGQRRAGVCQRLRLDPGGFVPHADDRRIRTRC